MDPTAPPALLPHLHLMRTLLPSSMVLWWAVAWWEGTQEAEAQWWEGTQEAEAPWWEGTQEAQAPWWEGTQEAQAPLVGGTQCCNHREGIKTQGHFTQCS